ncbi:MAG: hypothetical protein JJU36_01845, partial [Phycisphaeraceae bacterium]|nr:hypothetical protein [Phycisphaeraceae bacterium]
TNVRQARGESFIELYLTDPKWFDEKVLPTFAGLGITMPHGPLSEPMRDAVLDSLRPREGSVADQARELFEGLESETFATREAATQKLTDEFSAFEELIRAELAREGISTERRARLEQVVAESGTAAPSPAQDARNLGLLDNITYLKHLADHPELSDDDRKTIRQRISALEER